MTIKISGTPPTEIFVNEYGGICIKQENDSFYGEDPFVYFSINEAEAIIEAIKKTIEEAKEVQNGMD